MGNNSKIINARVMVLVLYMSSNAGCQSSMGNNSKIINARVMVLVLCMSSNAG